MYILKVRLTQRLFVFVVGGVLASDLSEVFLYLWQVFYPDGFINEQLSELRKERWS